MHLSERLSLLRSARDIPQKELALHLRLTVATVSNYENGVHQPDLDTLCRLADFYGVSTDYLLGRTRYPAPVPYPRRRGSGEALREKIFLELDTLSPGNLHTLECLLRVMKRHEITVSPNGCCQMPPAGNQPPIPSDTPQQADGTSGLIRGKLQDI